jgi:hypothetical protein
LSTVPILRLLCLYAGVRGIDILLPPVLFARRRERFLFWYCLMLLILAPAAGVIGAVWNGAQGTVMLATPVYCAVMAVMAREALTEMEAEFSELWTCLWPIMAATVLMAMTVLLVQQFALAERPDPPLVRLLFLSASGAIVYGATLFAIGSPVISEGAEVLGWILRRRRADS